MLYNILLITIIFIVVTIILDSINYKESFSQLIGKKNEKGPGEHCRYDTDCKGESICIRDPIGVFKCSIY
tara:strand:- start:890 stop:1099 length:210 start_codon:yes stop_codon:yes gene_type:complete